MVVGLKKSLKSYDNSGLFSSEMWQDRGEREWTRCGTDTSLPVLFWVCGRERLKERDRIGYAVRSFSCCWEQSSLLFPAICNSVPGMPGENGYQPGTHGASDAGVSEVRL